jgi:predicted nuclease of restriction endonuclease-like (RecB) superfamily
MADRSSAKASRSASAPRPSAAPLPADYANLLTEIKTHIRTAQIKAALAVNRELLQLYWDIGGLIVKRQREEGWGRSVVERLAVDIQRELPGISGFSRQNIWYMRACYLAWTDEVQNLQQAVGDSGDEFLPVLPPEAALLRRHRPEDDAFQA